MVARSQKGGISDENHNDIAHVFGAVIADRQLP